MATIQTGVQLDLTTFMEPRELMASKIVAAGDSIRKVTKNFFQVRSQSTGKWYKVKKLPNAEVWTCECPDFMYRLSKNTDKRCKHIVAVQSLRKGIELESKVESTYGPKICPHCQSDRVVKDSPRTLKDGSKRQRYLCNSCRKTFVLTETGFAKVCSDPHIIVEAISLMLGGFSLRKAARFLLSNHQVEVTHVTIKNWMTKYTDMMKAYVDKLIPEFQDVWSADELMLNVKGTEEMGKGFYLWVWSIIYPQTRYVIASELSKRRDLKDARKVLKNAKAQVESDPSYIITDALRSYETAIIKEFDSTRTAHVKTKSLSEGFANRPIERYHNEIRELTKTKRGLGNEKSAQNFMDLKKIEHNYLRPHAGLPNNMTPAEASGLDLKLGENKLLNLIKKSAAAKVESKKEYTLEPQLGKRMQFVDIKTEADCISVKPKGWIPKNVWREINDILFINGFSWLENERESQWMKFRDIQKILESDKTKETC